MKIMKKVVLYSFLCCSLFACKSQINEPQNTHFEEGEEVTIAVGSSQPNNSARRIDGYTRSSVDPQATGGIDNIDFQWNEGDKITIYVTDNDGVIHHSEFRMLNDEQHHSQVGSDNVEDKNFAFNGIAYFRGKMPAENPNDTFTIVYGPDKVPAEQKYHYDGIAKNTMRFAAHGCSLDGISELIPQWSAIRVNFSSSCGFDIEIDQDAAALADDPSVVKHNLAGGFNLSLTKKEDGTKQMYHYSVMREVSTGTADEGLKYCVVVVDPGTYTLLEITPDKQGNSYGEKDGKVIIVGKCEQPKTYHMNQWAPINEEGIPGSYVSELTLKPQEYLFLDGLISVNYIYVMANK